MIRENICLEVSNGVRSGRQVIVWVVAAATMPQVAPKKMVEQRESRHWKTLTLAVEQTSQE